MADEEPTLDVPKTTGDAPIDPGAAGRHQWYTEKDYEGHRAHTVYVGLHVPTGPKRRSHRRHRQSRGNSAQNNAREGSIADNSAIPPSQRVQFILGEEAEDDDTHESHPLFSEMEELFYADGGNAEWKETARWVKFEEVVEEGGSRWSKPHVATLSLHSLFELRSFVLNGSVLLDAEASSLLQVAELVVDSMVNSGHLPLTATDKVCETILRRHRHLYEKNKESSAAKLPIIRSLADIGRTYSSMKNNSNNLATSPSSASMLRNASGNDVQQGNGDVPKGNTQFLKKIPPGAEVSNVLVGEVDFLEKPVCAFVRLKNACVLGDLTEVPIPTRFLFILLGPVGGQASYHEIGRAMATLFSDEVFHEVAYRGKSRNHLLAGVDEFLDSVTVLPPGEWDPNIRIEPPAAIPSQDTRKFPEKFKEEINEEEEEARIRKASGLVRSGRIFGGLIDDIKRKAPWYCSDYKDALSLQCIAAFSFLYFACLTPIITFGGLLSDATGNRLGTIESLCSGFLCGIIYGLFSGQPMTILGSTGPVLVFETIMFGFCERNGLDFLALRVWIGVWIGVILLILVAVDASALVCYITRFTEENFALLIATIFIYKAIEKVIYIGQKNPLDPPVISNCSCVPSNYSEVSDSFDWMSAPLENCTSVFNGTLTGSDCNWVGKTWYPNVFLMSVILCSFTFILCRTLKNMKSSNFFPTWVRATISDFGVFIAICSMAGLDVFSGIKTPKLEVPAEFKPTWEGRGWFIDPFTNPGWTIPASVLPALLATILIFMDQQITAVIINRRENKLKKGCGYHLDMFVLALLIILKSFLGLPWFVAATVLSINHVNALKLQTETAAPGEKPQFLGVREQRVTLIIISLMIGLSVFMTKILTYIPMPVLYGVFLYMGTSPLADMQFYDRLLIMFMPTKYQPDHIYLRKVPLRRVHLFTLIQLVCFIMLWVVKMIDAISIAFPLMLVVMIGVRKSLDFIFTKYELKVLDDLMPETTKKKILEAEDDDEGESSSDKGDVNIQYELPSGNIMKIPVSPKKKMNISEEVNRSGVWKNVNSSNVLATVNEVPTCRKNRRTSKDT